jgi:N-acyl-phosphatidylethanolamine-hydrolysing phospholipase D
MNNNESSRVDTTGNELVEARLINGAYTNSFNPRFRMPSVSTIVRWMFRAPNNTRLPANLDDLDQILPVIKHRKDDIFKEKTGLRLLWIGHASCLVQIDDFIFLTDPVFSDRCGITSQLGSKRYRRPALTVDELPDELQAVCISHNHFDHLDYPSVHALNQRYGNALTWFCGIGTRQWFIDCQIENVIELNWWQQQAHPVGKTHHVLNNSSSIVIVVIV